MKKCITILIFLISLFTIISVSKADYYISSCQIIDQPGVYYLTQDIENYTGDVCFNITSDNVTLDCQGHLVDGVSYSDSSKGIVCSGYNNITIKNCILKEWNYPILLTYSNSSKIYNTTCYAGMVYIRYNNKLDISYLNVYGVGGDKAFQFIYNNNSVIRNSKFDLLEYDVMYSYNDTIYNNIINATDLTFFRNNNNYYNTTKTQQTNIIGGPYIGGNYWTNPNGNGYSDICLDSDFDGICDEPYQVESGCYDYLPLTKYINITITTLNKSIFIDDKPTINFHVYGTSEYYNCSLYSNYVDINNLTKFVDVGDIYNIANNSANSITPNSTIYSSDNTLMYINCSYDGIYRLSKNITIQTQGKIYKCGAIVQDGTYYIQREIWGSDLDSIDFYPSSSSDYITDAHCLEVRSSDVTITATNNSYGFYNMLGSAIVVNLGHSSISNQFLEYFTIKNLTFSGVQMMIHITGTGYSASSDSFVKVENNRFLTNESYMSGGYYLDIEFDDQKPIQLFFRNNTFNASLPTEIDTILNYFVPYSKIDNNIFKCDVFMTPFGGNIYNNTFYRFTLSEYPYKSANIYDNIFYNYFQINHIDTNSYKIYNNKIYTDVTCNSYNGHTAFNTTKTQQTNIIGGPYIGGNYWTNPNGNGYSDICLDSDFDGICDEPYNNTCDIDYLPLATNKVYYFNESVTYPSNYSCDETLFNITWKSSFNNLDKSLVEANFTGLYKNYTMNLYEHQNNIWKYYFTINLPAGTYSYRFIANTTDGYSNSTNYKTFTIHKTTPTIHLFLNNQENDITTDPFEYIEVSVDSDTYYNIPIRIESNYTGLSDYSYTPYNNSFYVYHTGKYYIKAIFDGDSNYTSSSSTLYFNVNPILEKFTTGIIVSHQVSSSNSEIHIIEGAYTPIRCSVWGKPGIDLCYDYCPNCYSEVNKKVRWSKNIILRNDGNLCAHNYVATAHIPTSTYSTNDVVLLDENDNIHTIDEININDGYIKWKADIPPGEHIWTLFINTTPPYLTYKQEDNLPKKTFYINISGSKDLLYNNVFSYISLNYSTTKFTLYDNTTGNMYDVTNLESYGPPSPLSLNNSTYYNIYKWITPSISPNQRDNFVLETLIGNVVCSVVSKKILNEPPILPNENIRWEWRIECMNNMSFQIPFTTKIRIPLDSSLIKLNNTPIKAGFYTTPPYGPYIEISDTIGPLTNNTYILNFITPSVTSDLLPPTFPEAFYVGQSAKLIQYVRVRNWGDSGISYVTQKIPIRYGKDLKVYFEGKLIDEVDLVQGYYNLNITDIRPYETREYMIVYYIPTATAEIKRYFRRVINKTQYIVYPVKITSTSGYPLSPLYITFEQENPFKCSDVDFILVSDENSYLSPPNTGEKLSFRCSGNFTIVKLKDLPTGQSEYIDVFVIEEQPSPVTPFYKPIHDFFDWLYSIIKSFIEWITSFAR